MKIVARGKSLSTGCNTGITPNNIFVEAVLLAGENIVFSVYIQL